MVVIVKLQTLYKTAKTGATQVFNIESNGDSYTTTWGQVNGKQQSKTTTCSPKNVGRSNETTAAEQAILEATAKWTKKQKANYSTDETAPVMQKLPMKVNEYKKHIRRIKKIVYTSPKLNGVNCEYRLTDGKLELLSRGGENYPIPKHQEIQALALLETLGTTSVNGEMYCHGMFLQDIMAATKKHNEDTPKLKFHVFDFPEVEGTYLKRCEAMYAKKDEEGAVFAPNFPFIPVWVARSLEEIDDQYEQCMDAGYEGLIVRNPEGLYEYNTRSLNVFKYKKAQDGEFLTIDFTLDKNGHAVFICAARPPRMDEHLPDVPTFKVKLKGTAGERLEMASKADSYLGKHLKVEFEMLSRDGIPQKPVGIMFRKVDKNGEAIE